VLERCALTDLCLYRVVVREVHLKSGVEFDDLEKSIAVHVRVFNHLNMKLISDFKISSFRYNKQVLNRVKGVH